MKKAICRGSHVKVNLSRGWIPATIIDFEYGCRCYSAWDGKMLNGHYIYTILTTKGKTERVHECLVRA